MFEKMLACYDEESEAAAKAAAEAAAAEAAAAEAAKKAAGEKTFTQTQVNAYLADERRKEETKHRAQLKAELQRQEKTYTELLANKNLTETELEQVRANLEEVEKQLHTKEERLTKEKKQVEEQLTLRLTEVEKKAKDWETRYQEASIKRELQEAAVTNEAWNASQMVTALRPYTKLAPLVVNGQPTGEFQVVVDLNDVVDGKPVVTQLTPDAALKRMKELPDLYGNLFKAGVVPGLGGSATPGNLASGGKIDVSKLSQAEYRKIRKEHPELLGLARTV